VGRPLAPHPIFSAAADGTDRLRDQFSFEDRARDRDRYHVNGNLIIQPGLWGRVEPYATVGIGTSTGSTVAAADIGPTEFRQYQK
jgi:hypothetical protein